MPLVRFAAAATIIGLYSAPKVASDSHPSACFEYGTDYAGYDILALSGVGNPSLCMESCTQTAECGYWSWIAETNSCYLKSASAVVGRTEAENVISGPRTCFAQGACFSEGVDYVGYDVNRVEGKAVPSAQACQELCSAEPRCAFFSYKISTKDCYMKSLAAPIGRSVDEDVISGPRVCSQGDGDNSQPDVTQLPELPELPEQTCAEGAVEFRGHDIAVMRNVRSAPHCQQLCVSNNTCFYWTWDKNRQTCYLKDQHAGDFRVTGRQTLGKVSGARDCLPINPGCQNLDTTFLGSVVLQLRNSATFETCQQNCQNNKDCEFWTWDVRSKLCQLRKAEPYGYVSDSSTIGMLAGPKYCPNDDVCVEQADYVGYDLEAIEDGSVATAVECRTICRRTEGCEFWTWTRSTGNCYLKTEDALLGKTNGLASLGKFSGPRECFMHYGCVEPNAAYMSPSATLVKNVGTYRECESRCQRDSTCTRWTYLSNTRVCILLNANDTTPKVPFDGALSGSKCSGVESVNEHQCLTMGIKYKATDMALIANSKSVNDCHFECINATGCTAFTFEESVGCSLYNQDIDTLTRYPIKFPTAISGIPQCGEDSEGEKDVCYEDSIIQGTSFYSFNASECAARCSEVPSCVYWTYNPKRRIDSCTLHKAGATKNERCTGARSGTKGTQAGTYGFSKYDAPSVTVAGVKSAELCRAQCADNQMRFWTYYSITETCKLHAEGAYSRVPDMNAVCGTVEDPLA